jgi:hypothetical protein
MKFALNKLKILPKEVNGHVEAAGNARGDVALPLLLCLNLSRFTCRTLSPLLILSVSRARPTFSSLLIDNFSRDSLFLTSASDLLKSLWSGRAGVKFFFDL